MAVRPPFYPPLVNNWIASFSRTNTKTRVVVRPPFRPPQGALNPQLGLFLDGKSDFAFLTREIAEADLARFREAHKSDPLIVPVANGSADRFGYVDPVVIIVNGANPLRVLSFAQIDALFSSSRLRGLPAIRSWETLNGPGWRGKPVHLTGGGGWAGEESARALTVRRLVLSVNGEVGRWQSAPDSGGEADVVGRVAADPLAIGFTGLGHITSGVRVLPISMGRTLPVFPDRAAVSSGRYPLARTVDLLIAPDRAGRIDPGLAAFVRFIINAEGQGIVRRDGVFLPLRPGQAQHALRLAANVCR